jgi:cation diffusion facilitator CzcD-associated flavoprotein CzcO
VVPVVSDGTGAVKKITQFAKQAHWLAERPNPEFSRAFKWLMNWVPFALRIYRAGLYWEKESGFRGFNVVSGANVRKSWTKNATEYIQRNAPAKCRDFLVPKTEIGCKRRVNDTDYLACLHREIVELIYNDPVEEIESLGIRTRSGKKILADAIILAHGFEKQKPLSPMIITGKDGKSVIDHVSLAQTD